MRRIRTWWHFCTVRRRSNETRLEICLFVGIEVETTTIFKFFVLYSVSFVAAQFFLDREKKFWFYWNNYWFSNNFLQRLFLFVVPIWRCCCYRCFCFSFFCCCLLLDADRKLHYLSKIVNSDADGHERHTTMLLPLPLLCIPCIALFAAIAVHEFYLLLHDKKCPLCVSTYRSRTTIAHMQSDERCVASFLISFSIRRRFQMSCN